MRRTDVPGHRLWAVRAALALAVATIFLLTLIGPAAPAAAANVGGAPTPPPTTAIAVPSPDIIPQPNSGHAPRDAGERGGAQQTLVFFLVCLGLVVLFGLVWRESRRKLAARARAESASPRPNQPKGSGTAVSSS